MAGMAVYRTPPPPGAWAGSDIVRIVDPLGLAIAWVAPELGGACIGFSVREDTGSSWRTVFETEPPRDHGVDDLLGLEPLIGTDESTVLPARMSGERWSMLERDPTTVTVGSNGQEGDSTVTVACESGALEMTLNGDRFAGVRLVVPATTAQSICEETGNSGERTIAIPLPDVTLLLSRSAELLTITQKTPDVGITRIDLSAKPSLLAPIRLRSITNLTRPRTQRGTPDCHRRPLQ